MNQKSRNGARKSVVVVGAAAMDLVFRTEELPQWHEAVQASAFTMLAGGKALNQAIAVSRLGMDVALIAAVGDDDWGNRIRQELVAAGVDTRHVKSCTGVETPAVGVFVRSGGEASFVGWKNSDGVRLTVADIELAAETIVEADYLLVTLEASLEAITAAMRIARQADTQVVLNPAPPAGDNERAATMAMLKDVDILVPNMWEATKLLGRLGSRYDPVEVAEQLCSRGVETVCVTTSEYGCVVAVDGEEPKEYAGFPTYVADTTGGSDAFCAALAVYLCRGKPFNDAIMRANAAGSIAVRGLGGSSSMPTAEDIDRVVRGGGRRRRGFGA